MHAFGCFRKFGNRRIISIAAKNLVAHTLAHGFSFLKTELARPAPQSSFRACRQQHAYVGIGGDDRCDVAAFGDAKPEFVSGGKQDGALAFLKDGPDVRVGCHSTHARRDFLGADLV